MIHRDPLNFEWSGCGKL